MMHIYTFNKGDTLIEKGATYNFVGVVLEGVVNVAVSDLDVVQQSPGAFLVEQHLFSSQAEILEVRIGDSLWVTRAYGRV